MPDCTVSRWYNLYANHIGPTEMEQIVFNDRYLKQTVI